MVHERIEREARGDGSIVERVYVDGRLFTKRVIPPPGAQAARKVPARVRRSAQARPAVTRSGRLREKDTRLRRRPVVNGGALVKIALGGEPLAHLALKGKVGWFEPLCGASLPAGVRWSVEHEPEWRATRACKSCAAVAAGRR